VVRHLALDPPAVPVETVLRLARYRDLARVPRAIREAAVDVAAEARRLAAPEIVLWRGPVTSRDPAGAVTLADRHRFHSAVLARVLGPCPEAVVFVLTAGPAIEQRAQSMLADKLLLEAFLLDTAAWVAIEQLVRSLRQQLLAEERPAGRFVTHRLAPGYCDWPLEEQTELLAVFGESPLPVTLNEAACMFPCKSISGVFGIVPAASG
jgi:hypothetical protein